MIQPLSCKVCCIPRQLILELVYLKKVKWYRLVSKKGFTAFDLIWPGRYTYTHMSIFWELYVTFIACQTTMNLFKLWISTHLIL